jgi:hypothetical protein
VHRLCYCWAVAGLSCHHHLLSSGDYHKVSSNKLLQFIQDVGLLLDNCKVMHNRSVLVMVQGRMDADLSDSILLYPKPQVLARAS